jgi:hypothetical protein
MTKNKDEFDSCEEKAMYENDLDFLVEKAAGAVTDNDIDLLAKLYDELNTLAWELLERCLKYEGFG